MSRSLVTIKTVKIISLFMVVCISYVYGIISYKNEIFPYPQLKKIKIYFYEDKEKEDENLLTSKEKINCKEIINKKTMIAIAFGQSNSANFGEKRYDAKESVFNFHDGQCYKARDPLLGAGGKGGSVWILLGDKLIQRGLFENVVFVSIGVGASEIARWKPGGDLHEKILRSISQLNKNDIQITHMFWHQGEKDRLLGTTKKEYQQMFMDMLESIRDHGVDAPIYVAVASRCANKLSKEIQLAQLGLINYDKKIYPGPNTDVIDSLDDRYDACHFSDIGMKKHASVWLDAIMETKFSKKTSTATQNFQ